MLFCRCRAPEEGTFEFPCGHDIFCRTLRVYRGMPDYRGTPNYTTGKLEGAVVTQGANWTEIIMKDRSAARRGYAAAAPLDGEAG